MNDQGRERWLELLRRWSVDPIQADRKFEEICRSHSGPGRFYHTLDHVLTVLGTVESLAVNAKNLKAVKLAAWLHDVIYDSKVSDNEERSAEYAERLCEELAIPEGHRVAALIRKTKTHDAGDDVDAQVLLDADLAILGASESDYHAYQPVEKGGRESWDPCQNRRNNAGAEDSRPPFSTGCYAEKIRREYAWVPEPEYRKGRRQVLERFLTRSKIFHYLRQMEEPARQNLASEIALLAATS